MSCLRSAQAWTVSLLLAAAWLLSGWPEPGASAAPPRHSPVAASSPAAAVPGLHNDASARIAPRVVSLPPALPSAPAISRLTSRPATMHAPMPTNFGPAGLRKPAPGHAFTHAMRASPAAPAAASPTTAGFDSVPHCAGDTNPAPCTGPLVRGVSSAVVQHHPRVYLIFWGPNWNTINPDYEAVINNQQQLFLHLAGTPHDRLLGQYGDNGDFPHDDPVLAGTWIDAQAPTLVSDITAGMEAVRAAQINSWTNSMDTDFLVYPQDGSILADTQACGAHSLYNDFSTGNLYLTAYIDYPRGACQASVNGNPITDRETVVTSHEYFEMITDPDTQNGYRAGAGREIGDLCNRQAGTNPAGLYVQTEYDNLSGSCRLDADGDTGPPVSVRIGTLHVTPTAPTGVQQTTVHVNMQNFELTTTNTAGSGQLVVYPYGEPIPATADINLTAGATQTQFVSVALGYQGYVAFSTTGTATTDVTIDYLGNSNDGFENAHALSHAINSLRVDDSRSPTPGCLCGPIAAHSIGYARFDIDINGNQTGVQAGTDGVDVHITAVSPAAPGYLTAWPSFADLGGAFPPSMPGSPPDTTSVSFAAGQTTGNDVIVGPAKDQLGGQYGYFAIYNGSAATLNYIVDLQGFSTNAAYGSQSPVSTATRLEDSRNCAPLQGSLCGRLAANTTYTVQIQGRTPNIPSAGMVNVLLHVTSLNSAGPGYIQVWNAAAPAPNTSVNQTAAGKIVNDSTYVPLSSAGTVNIRSSVTTDVIVELQEWGAS